MGQAAKAILVPCRNPACADGSFLKRDLITREGCHQFLGFAKQPGALRSDDLGPDGTERMQNTHEWLLNGRFSCQPGADLQGAQLSRLAWTGCWPGSSMGVLGVA